MLLSTRLGLLTLTCLENNSAPESRHKNKASCPIVRVARRGKQLHTPCLAAHKRQHHSACDLSVQIYIVPDVNHSPIWLPKSSMEMTEVYHQMLRADSKTNPTYQMTSNHITEKLQTKYSFCQNKEMKESVWFKHVSWDLTQTAHLFSSKTQSVNPSAWSQHLQQNGKLFIYLLIYCVCVCVHTCNFCDLILSVHYLSIWGLNLGHQPWWQQPLSSELFQWPLENFFFFLISPFKYSMFSPKSCTWDIRKEKRGHVAFSYAVDLKCKTKVKRETNKTSCEFPGKTMKTPHKISSLVKSEEHKGCEVRV